MRAGHPQAASLRSRRPCGSFGSLQRRWRSGRRQGSAPPKHQKYAKNKPKPLKATILHTFGVKAPVPHRFRLKLRLRASAECNPDAGISGAAAPWHCGPGAAPSPSPALQPPERRVEHWDLLLFDHEKY